MAFDHNRSPKNTIIVIRIYRKLSTSYIFEKKTSEIHLYNFI